MAKQGSKSVATKEEKKKEGWERGGDLYNTNRRAGRRINLSKDRNQ
jgi:hypothetical protein